MIKSSLRITFLIATFTFAVAFGSAANAAHCGAGTIVDIKEGGWNTDDLMIKLEGANASANTLFQGFVRFRASALSAARLEAIRRLATTAFALDAKVWTFSHNGTCTSATEISMLQ